MVLAGRWQRLGAAILDGFIGLVGHVVLGGTPWPIDLELLAEVLNGAPPSLGLALARLLLGFGFFVVVHGYFLMTNGQTLGKKALGIRVTRVDGTAASLARLVCLRSLPVWLAGAVPPVGPLPALVMLLPLLDPLFVFRRDRRCLHDLMSGTRVVVAGTPAPGSTGSRALP